MREGSADFLDVRSGNETKGPAKGTDEGELTPGDVFNSQFGGPVNGNVVRSSFPCTLGKD